MKAGDKVIRIAATSHGYTHGRCYEVVEVGADYVVATSDLKAKLMSARSTFEKFFKPVSTNNVIEFRRPQ